ncbi:MAG: hypothetical protein ACXABM_05615, partial [Candidatus Thorarchaeota archaeon]
MSEEWYVPKPKILIILILLACVVIMMSIPRFGYIYPDSSYYLDMVEFFSGNIPGSELAAPFGYRPMLPLIVAFLPLATEISFAMINLIFLLLISWIIFFSSLKRDSSPLVAFLTTMVFIVSLVYLFYGAVVLVDPGAVLFLSLAYYYMMDQGQGKKISIFLTLGVLFKELALVGVLTYLLYWKLKEWWLMIPPIGTYVILRIIMPSGNPDFIWTFHLSNIVTFGEQTLKTFLFGMAPFLILLILAYFHKRRNTMDKNDTSKWLIAGGIPALAYLILGLFFAHFDVRFFWPFYLVLIPLCTDGVSEFFRFIRFPLNVEST